MTLSPEEEEVANVHHPGPLPELHPDNLTIQVDLPSSSTENVKLPLKQDPDGKVPQAEPPVDALSSQQSGVPQCIFRASRHGYDKCDRAGRVRVANRWAGLLEALGFVEWPPVAGNDLKILVVTIPPVGLGVCLVVCLAIKLLLKLLRCGRTTKLSLVRAFSKVYLCTAIALLIGNTCIIFGVGSHLSSGDLVRSLAKQTGASASFNQAWCRQSSKGTAAFLRGECGPDTTTVFAEIVGWFKVGDWCKEAIATQNFDMTAAYNGISPLACLNDTGGIKLTQAMASDILQILSGVFGLCLFANWAELENTIKVST